MNPFDGVLPNFLEIFSIISWLFIHGGWVVLLITIIYLFYYLYRKEIEHQVIAAQPWTFLSIKVPRENLASTLAVEAMFSQMHALHSSLTFAETVVEGRIQLWYSLEIISLGGKISYVMRVPTNYRDLAEAAIYSQYSDAEISEIDDYMENINYDPNTSDFEVWGTEFGLVEDEVIPIKTYKDFEHPAAEEKIIDPLAGHFEALAKMEPWEFYGVQILIQPLADDEWKGKGENKIKELIGEEPEHKVTVGSVLMAPLNAFANFRFSNLFGGGAHKHGEEDNSNQRNNWMGMTEGQKERVTLIERKISKPGYKTKIRHIYITPKDKFIKKKPYVVIGSYRPLGSTMNNKLKPSGKIWTSLPYKFSPDLEKPYINRVNAKRKKNVFKAYKERDIHIGLPGYILNVEEIATLYHFPLSTKPVSSTIEKTESKRSQAPVNLPVGEI